MVLFCKKNIFPKMKFSRNDEKQTKSSFPKPSSGQNHFLGIGQVYFSFLWCFLAQAFAANCICEIPCRFIER